MRRSLTYFYSGKSVFKAINFYNIMIICISGVPGTGKTEIARILEKSLNYKLISIKSLLKKVKTTKDKKRNVRIVDVKDLQKIIPKEKNLIIEGHLSHFLKSDLLVILRTRPDVLEKRLIKRKWSKNKIVENVQAEILDEITIQALENNKKIVEIDTTNKKEKVIANNIMSLLNIQKYSEKNFGFKRPHDGLLNNMSTLKKYRLGKISWSVKFKDYLFRNE